MVILTALIGLWALASFGCGRAEESSLVVAHRLLDVEGGPEAAGVPSTCAVGDQIRRARGCLPVLILGTEGGVKWDPTLRRRYPVPAALVGRDCVVERSYVHPGERRWQALPAFVVRAAASEVEVAFPLPSAVAAGLFGIQARIRPLPPAPGSIETPPTPIGRGAVLVGAVAVDPIGAEVGGAAVEFSVVARTPYADRLLVTQVLGPGVAASRPWTDFRIDVSELAGEAPRFVFTTRLIPQPGHPPEQSFGFPLWTPVDVLEPRAWNGQRNVILISLDTLRADFLGAYGARLPTTPALDRFASEGALFKEVITAYPSTTASHMSILTGVYPSVHGVFGPLTSLPADIPTLAEILTAADYRTAAITEDGMLSAPSGFVRGFSEYSEFKDAHPAAAAGHIEQVVTTALDWLARHRGEKFFLFLHTYQVHGPFNPPPAFDLFTGAGRNGPPTPASDYGDPHAYAGEVRYADVEMRRLLDGLAALGEADRTIVAITGDHGEAFTFDHGWIGHGLSLAEEVLRVPLLVRAPGRVPAGRRVSQLASLTDLAPTLLQLLGLPIPHSMQGLSLVPLLQDRQTSTFENRAVYAEMKTRNGGHQVAIRKGAFKWVVSATMDYAPQVYDLGGSFGEDANVATPDLAAEGQLLLERFHEGNQRAQGRLRGAVAAPAMPDERTIEKLRALGYVQ